MKKRPYFIEEDLGDTFGSDLFLSENLKKVIGDLIKSVNKFHPYHYSILLQIYNQVLSMPVFEDASELPIANYKPVPTWEKIVRIGVELIERCYLTKKGNELFGALYKSMEAINSLQKPEFYSAKDLPQIIKLESLDDLENLNESRVDDDLRKMLIHYHDLYDGSYKICLSLFHFLCDLLSNKYNSKKPYEKYLEDDVSYKIDKIQNYSTIIPSIENLKWLLIGADAHVRNAIAHKNWQFNGGKVLLFDKKGWKNDLTYLEIEDYIKNINIANKGMQAALLIGFSKYQKEMSNYFEKKIYDEDTIHSMLYYFAKRKHFLLDDFRITADKNIICNLKEEIVGEGREIIVSNKDYATKILVPYEKSKIYRIMGLLFEACQIIWNYKRITFEVFDPENNLMGHVENDLEKFADYYFSKKASKEDYESCIITNSIKEHS